MSESKHRSDTRGEGFDVLVIGAGLAGIAAALELADRRRVAVACKGPLAECATREAQGGIAAAMDPQDDCGQHVEDTVAAGAGLCDRDATRAIVAEGPSCVRWLASLGVRFTADAGEIPHLAHEGGHRRRRVVHADDATGRAVHRVLLQQLLAHPNVSVLERHAAVDLIVAGAGDARRCAGAWLLRIDRREVVAVRATQTVLATGGAGQLYARTSNPQTATGDGMAIAWRAGCRLANLEFVQFHPTLLYRPHGPSPLISEALRGEGALLRLPPGAGAEGGQRFMPRYDPRAELSPRDIVARAIETEMTAHRLDFVLLDITHRPAEFIVRHFPAIHDTCLAHGIDITREPIPVAPGAHYMCGGVVADASGKTDVEGLRAIGEVACTGLHGANRLASNSLLECVVMGRAAARCILDEPAHTPGVVAPWRGRIASQEATREIAGAWRALRETMGSEVGIVRTTRGLWRARQRIADVGAQCDALRERTGLGAALLELRNAAELAALMVESALRREESRGAHFNRDHPATLAHPRRSLLSPDRDRLLPAAHARGAANGSTMETAA
jgi:L-aspartate oxidase